MSIFAGLFIVFLCVFGGFMLAGGRFGIVAQALPGELLIIAGAAVGALVIANPGNVLRKVSGGIARVIEGERWGRDDYRDLLCLLFLIVRTLRTRGLVAVEAHIENPADSRLFLAFPRLLDDPELTGFICDYVRMMAMNFEDPGQMAEAMENDLMRQESEAMAGQQALQSMADALPALGIIAAVLGVIKTMGSIDQPTDVLGAMIGGALVGTFLGVLLSYTVVGPIAARLQLVIEGETRFLALVRTVIVAHLQGQAPQVAIEIGRRATPSTHAPSFAEMEAALRDLPGDLI